MRMCCMMAASTRPCFRMDIRSQELPKTVALCFVQIVTLGLCDAAFRSLLLEVAKTVTMAAGRKMQLLAPHLACATADGGSHYIPYQRYVVVHLNRFKCYTHAENN